MNLQSLIHLAWIVPLVLLVSYIGSPRFLGNMGSTRVRRILGSALEKNRYTILHDLVLPSGGGTFHVDHLVISRYGICVIDSIHRSGWISGTEVQARWRQQSWGKSWYFDNPVHTNYLRVQALERLLQLPNSRFHPMVVLSGHRGFKKNLPTGVLEVKNLVGRIRSLGREVLSAEEADKALLCIQKSIVKPGLFGRAGRWKLFRLLLFVVLVAASVMAYHDQLQQFLAGMQRHADMRMMPEKFHRDGLPKTELELWEDSLICAYSSDLGRCSCYEPGGAKARLTAARCQELAERGSVLKQ
ncbi:MAG TPA: nuclease-related domain-containing protein [Xanthomonadales bacterium]|nr:nuclease-related domain-containing protein [Xanthomonadales bacterium]